MKKGSGVMGHLDIQEIDFVIPWVDGSDPEWLKERSLYDTKMGDAREARYRDWGLMPYWFRAVEQYAPWVRKIHFITWGHIPEWLDTNNPKLHIVNHKDYIPSEYLPTFQSHPIELNMHRIEGLAEQFVYFNDDLFLTKEVSPEFFFKNGLPCDCYGLQPIVFTEESVGWINGSDIAVIHKHFQLRESVIKNWRKIFNLRNGIKRVIKTTMIFCCSKWFPGFYYNHITSAFLKSTLEELWKKESEVLDETCRCRFRGKTNVNQWLFKYWQLASGQFYPVSLKETKCFHLTPDSVSTVCQLIKNKTYAVLCINDSAPFGDITQAAKDIQAAFEEVLPDKCSFEKSE